MAPLAPYISLAGVGQVIEIYQPDESKPYSYIIYCNFYIGSSGTLSIPVLGYFEQGVPPEGSYVSVHGPFWLLTGTDGSIEADTVEVLTTDPKIELTLPPPAVTAVGTVVSVIGRSLYMDVGAYSREKRALVTYQIKVAVPDNSRRTNMRLPQAGTNLAICGTLKDFEIHEDSQDNCPSVEMENITFLPRTDFTRRDETKAGETAKRPLVISKVPEGSNPGRPMKKSKSGPIDAFTQEELSAGRSSQASSSNETQETTNSSVPPSLSSSARSTRSATNSSQPTTEASTSELKKVVKFSKNTKGKGKGKGKA